MNIMLIFLGAGVGGVLRYWISNLVHLLLDNDFPYGTLVVNISGSFLMGFLFVYLVNRVDIFSSQLRALLVIGMLGGYTTFSSFSIETVNLLESGYVLNALVNMLASVIFCVLAAWIGVIAGRYL